MPKRSSHFSLAGGDSFHLHAVWKNAKRKFALLTCTGSYFSLAWGPKNAKRRFALFTCRESEKMLAFFGRDASEKCDPMQVKIFCRHWQNKQGVPRCSSPKTEIIHPHWAQMSSGSVKAHCDRPTAHGSGWVASRAGFSRLGLGSHSGVFLALWKQTCHKLNHSASKTLLLKSMFCLILVCDLRI